VVQQLFVPVNHSLIFSLSYKDFILAACDVEGNFLVVKVNICRHTQHCCLTPNRRINTPIYFLACFSMRKDGFIFHSIFFLLNHTAQLGNPSLYILLLGVHAAEVPMDTITRKWRTPLIDIKT